MITTRYNHGLIEATTRYDQGLFDEPRVVEVASINTSAPRKGSLLFLRGLSWRGRSCSNTSTLASTSNDNEANPPSPSSRRASLLKHFPWKSRSNSYASNATTIVANCSHHEAISWSSTTSSPTPLQQQDNHDVSVTATATAVEPLEPINTPHQSSQLGNDIVSSLLSPFSGRNRPIDKFIAHRRQARKEEEIKREKRRCAQNKIKAIDDQHKRDIKKHREKQKRTKEAAKRKAELQKNEGIVREINARRTSREGEMLATQIGLWEIGVHVTEYGYRGAIRKLFTGYGVVYKGKVYLSIRTGHQ